MGSYRGHHNLPISPPYSGTFRFSPEGEEERNSFFGPCRKVLIETPGTGEERDAKEAQMKENLDMRLNRMMLGDDLPLFLQEFAVEWQEEKRKKGKGESRDKSVTGELKEEEEQEVSIVRVGLGLKKNLKRLDGVNDKGLNSRNLKELANKMFMIVKKQVKEDILDKIVTDQVDSWLL